MCKLCGGSHTVAYSNTIGGYNIQACPTCGPMPAEIQARKDAEFWERIKEAEKRIPAS